MNGRRRAAPLVSRLERLLAREDSAVDSSVRAVKTKVCLAVVDIWGPGVWTRSEVSHPSSQHAIGTMILHVVVCQWYRSYDSAQTYTMVCFFCGSERLNLQRGKYVRINAPGRSHCSFFAFPYTASPAEYTRADSSSLLTQKQSLTKVTWYLTRHSDYSKPLLSIHFSRVSHCNS
jgi:hypothetical protein